MILFTRPVPRPALWGGTLLKNYFHYPSFPDGIGQSWSFSAQEGEGKSNVICSDPFRGKTLLSLWEENPQLFDSPLSRFPVIISLVAPEDDLSLQIHPDDVQAAKEGFPSGKNEAWYFLEAEENASIVYGQRAGSKENLLRLIREDRWDRIMDHLPVRQGDFVYLPAGIIHALKKGSIVYEIQQATDVTYRFYDYHRKDALGRERELHLEKAVACVHYDLSAKDAHPPVTCQRVPGAEVTTFVANSSFCVRRYEISGSSCFDFDAYRLMTCVRGSGTADGQPVSIGMSFLVPAHSSLSLEGRMTLMCTSER